MRWLALALALVCASAQARDSVLSAKGFAQGQQKGYYARVESQGRTFEEARNQGFRLAIEQAIGPLVLSETVSQNGRIQRDQVISYTSGMIDHFNIISQNRTPNGWVLVIEVWVMHSSIAARVLNNGVTAGEIDGERLGARVETLLHERSQGDSVIHTVMKDYAQHAYNVELKAANIDFNQQRQVTVTVPFVISMNYNFAVALNEAMARVAQAPADCGGFLTELHQRLLWNGIEPPDCTARRARQYTFNISLKAPDRWVGSLSRQQFRYDDPEKFIAIKQAVDTADLVLNFTMLDNNGQIITRVCHDLRSYTDMILMYEKGNLQMRLDQSQRVAGDLRFSFYQDSQRLGNLRQQTANIVPRAQCRPIQG